MEQLDFTDFFRTKAEALDFQSRLAVITECIYKSDFNLETILGQQLGLRKKERFLNYLNENKITSDEKVLREFLENLQKKISSLTVASMKIAFEPDERIIGSISEWFLINLKKQVLLEIIIDKSLIGGVDISYSGEFRNYSIREDFEKILNETLEEKNEAQNADKKATSESAQENPSADNFSIPR